MKDAVDVEQNGCHGSESIRVTRSVALPPDEIELRVSRSSGPGGQHAQKSETRVEAIFDVEASAALTPAQKRRVIAQGRAAAPSVAQDERSQLRNRELAVERLVEQLREALKVERRRVPTKPSAAARKRRLESKNAARRRSGSGARPASENAAVFDHVTIHVSDRAASSRFYATVLAPLGHSVTASGDDADEGNDFGVSQALDARPPTRGLHVAFVARSRGDVDAFWRTGIEAGYADDGRPGVRPEYHEDYYGGFLLDPDGNSAEAVYHGRAREGANVVDHLWIRVSDLDETRRFYETIVPVLGLRIANAGPERFHVAGGDRSFALVRGEPTANVHIAFPAADRATVDEFHRIAVSAGYRDNGPPGERHDPPRRYGAHVLDPDGTDVGAVTEAPL